MNSPTAVLVVRCMIRDTIRQSLASRGFWLLVGLSGLCILLCLSVGVEGATAVRPKGEIELYGADHQPYTGLNRGHGTISLGFGAVRVEQWRDPESSVRMLEILLALVVAGAVGMLLLCCCGRAAFCRNSSNRRAASVLLTKPVPRWALLVGKFCGVLGVRCRSDRFLRRRHLGGPRPAHRRLASRLSGVHSAAGAAVRGAVQLLRAAGRLDAEHGGLRRRLAAVLGLVFVRERQPPRRGAWRPKAEHAPAVSPVVQGLLEVGYWVLPKPVDLEAVSRQALRTEQHFRPLPELKALESDRSSLVLSVLTSLLVQRGPVGRRGQAAWRELIIELMNLREEIGQ